MTQNGEKNATDAWNLIYSLISLLFFLFLYERYAMLI